MFWNTSFPISLSGRNFETHTMVLSKYGGGETIPNIRLKYDNDNNNNKSRHKYKTRVMRWAVKQYNHKKGRYEF